MEQTSQVIDIGANLTAVLIALIAGVPAAIAAFYGHKAATKITETHELVNSQTARLVTIEKAASRAEGVTAGAAGEAPGTMHPPV